MTERPIESLSPRTVTITVPVVDEVPFTFAYHKNTNVLEVAVPKGLLRMRIEYGMLFPGETVRQKHISVRDTVYNAPSHFVSSDVDRSLRPRNHYPYPFAAPKSFVEVNMIGKSHATVLAIVRKENGFSWYEIMPDNKWSPIDSYEFQE